MVTFEIDGTKVVDFPTFIDEINCGLILHFSGQMSWKGNLDALNDYLSWPDRRYRLVILNSDRVRSVLSHIDDVGEDDLTLWDAILDIFNNNSKHVEVHLQ